MVDGLRIILIVGDTNVMCSFVDRLKNLDVYIDQEDTLGRISWDDVVLNPISQLPKVFSPGKVQHIEVQQCERLPNFYKDRKKAKEAQEEARYVREGAGNSSEEDTNYELLG